MNANDEQNLEKLRQGLKKMGMRVTGQREKIWHLFSTHRKGLTIAEAADSLKNDGIGHATVYRTVKDLKKMGFLQWIHDENGEHRFVACTSPHCHPLICRSCGQVVEFDCHGLVVLEKLLMAETGFVVEGHHLEIYGCCPECIQNKKEC